MKNVWDQIGDITPDNKDPKEIVKEMFNGLKKITKDALYATLQNVTFFPEEVEYVENVEDDSLSSIFGEHKSISSLWLNYQIPKLEPLPHPDFGYDVSKAKDKKWLRYRVLIHSKHNNDITYELFKFKYSTDLYPLFLYISEGDFENLDKFFQRNNENGSKGKIKYLIINNEKDLSSCLTNIITSKQTIELIKKMMVIK